MSTAPEFSPAAPGTSEDEWRREFDRRPAMPSVVLDGTEIIVVAAHPDDESLGCGGLVHRAAQRGVPVTLVLATWGEASHPGSPTVTPNLLAARRQGEMLAALDELGPGRDAIELVPLGLPDGDLAGRHHELTSAIVDIVATRAGRSVTLVAPWRHDGHPDHEAAGRAATAAAARTDSRILEYPIWFWHWATPQDLPARGLVVHRLNDADVAAKQAAIEAHTSQIAPLSDDAADAAILPPHVLARFRRGAELFLYEPNPTDHRAFDPLHRADADPWRTGSGYERSKRRATLAMLNGMPRPQRALEVGCSVGALTADLAAVCDRVDALDASPAAVEYARRRCSDLPGVDVRCGAAPDDIPGETYDLVVLSEVGYFLSPNMLRRTIGAVHRRLRRGGLLIACHWTHPVEGWLLDGYAVHRMIRDVLGTPLRSAPHRDYVLDLWRCR